MGNKWTLMVLKDLMIKVLSKVLQFKETKYRDSIIVGRKRME
jgi:hypothetical protein